MTKTRFFLIEGHVLYRTVVLPDGGLQGEAYNSRSGGFEVNLGYLPATQGSSDLECEELTELAFEWYLKKRQTTPSRDIGNAPQEVTQVTPSTRRRSETEPPVIDSETILALNHELLSFLQHPLNLKCGLLNGTDGHNVLLHLPQHTSTLCWSPSAGVHDTYVFMAVLRNRLWDTLQLEGFVASYGYGERVWIRWGETHHSHDGHEYASVLHRLRLKDAPEPEVLGLLRCINGSEWWSEPSSEETSP